MKNLLNFLISHDLTIKDAILLLEKNTKGIIFVTNQDKLVGVITDGDLRRAILNGSNNETIIKDVMNTEFVSLPVESSEQEIRKTFKSNLKLLPLCNNEGHIVDLVDPYKSHKIPILEPSLKGNELLYVKECIDTNWISSQGSYVRLFEQRFEELFKDMFALTVSNGSVALHLGLVSLGIGRGDEVIVPNITFAASINAIIHAGATPVLCEINKDTLCIDPKEIELLISSKTKAIMPVHLYGQACDMDAILTLADKFNLKIIEDCAEAIGSTWKNKYVGSFGDVSTFSFFGNKTISTGEGGMVIFQDEAIYMHAKTLRDHGMNPNKKYWHDNVGYNYRLTNIQSAIGVAQMEQLEQIIEKKLYILKFYRDHLLKEKNIRYLPQTRINSVNSNWLFTLVLQPEINRDDVILDLLNFGIDCRPIFYPLHQMEPYKNFKKSSDLATSVSVSYSGISLPSSVNITDDEMAYIVKKLSKILIARTDNNIIKN